MKLNVVFPIGKKPEIAFHESHLADKDCYIYWDMEYLKLQPSWMPKEDIQHKEVYAINSMQKRIDELLEQIADLSDEVNLLTNQHQQQSKGE